MVRSLFSCGALDSALGRSANPPAGTSSCTAQASAASYGGGSSDGLNHRASRALVSLSSALPRNTVGTGTSIIIRAHKIINCTDKISKQIDPKQKGKEGRCQLSIRKVSCYLQACSGAANAVFKAWQKETGNHQSNTKVVQTLTAALVAAWVVDLKIWAQIL